MRDIFGIRNPEWSQFHRLMRSHDLSESDMLKHLMKEHDNMELKEEFEEPQDVELDNELTERLDAEYQTLLEIKESISAAKEDIASKLKSLEERITPSRELLKKLEEIKTSLSAIRENQTPQKESEPLLTPQLIEILTKLKEQWGRKDLNEVVKVLLQSYYSK